MESGQIQLARQRLVEPAADEVRRTRRLGHRRFERPQQLDLAPAQPLPALRLRVGSPDLATELGVQLDDLGLAPAIQPALGDEVLQAGLGRFGNPDGQADQARRGLAPTPGRRAYLIHHQSVRGDGLVTMLDAQVAPGAVGALQPFGDGA